MTHAAKPATLPPRVRPIRADDFDQVFALAQRGGGGMTNLPPDREALTARIDHALASFAAGAREPGPEVYFMVLEVDGKILGTSAVFSAIGLDSGFVNYKVNWTFHASEQLGKRISRRTLVPTHDFTGCGEVGSLFLSPDARGGGLGKLLARARYLFIAQNPAIIADPICAELRGWRAPDGSQPFWDAVGARFFDMAFEDADVHNAANGNQFIADLMPRWPIYACLLPDAARECIGKPHDKALPAYKMLLAEGFEYNDYVDIFDAGPLVEARQKNIRTISHSRLFEVEVDDTIGRLAHPATIDLIASGHVADFRCVAAPAEIHGNRLKLSSDCAAALDVTSGDMVRHASGLPS